MPRIDGSDADWDRYKTRLMIEEPRVRLGHIASDLGRLSHAAKGGNQGMVELSTVIIKRSLEWTINDLTPEQHEAALGLQRWMASLDSLGPDEISKMARDWSDTLIKVAHLIDDPTWEFARPSDSA